MIRRAFGLGDSSPRHHDRSGGNACLLHYAQMSEQLRSRILVGLPVGPFYKVDINILIAMQDNYT